mmetsp:Transcript_5926/g.18223  ORF Transcript_5926/g.18223 Transcript_5926/m.18223 type:complete len:243 (-) Transcript_5926:3350-4078(-)
MIGALGNRPGARPQHALTQRLRAASRGTLLRASTAAAAAGAGSHTRALDEVILRAGSAGAASAAVTRHGCRAARSGATDCQWRPRLEVVRGAGGFGRTARPRPAVVRQGCLCCAANRRLATHRRWRWRRQEHLRLHRCCRGVATLRHIWKVQAWWPIPVGLIGIRYVIVLQRARNVTGPRRSVCVDRSGCWRGHRRRRAVWPTRRPTKRLRTRFAIWHGARWAGRAGCHRQRGQPSARRGAW